MGQPKLVTNEFKPNAKPQRNAFPLQSRAVIYSSALILLPIRILLGSDRTTNLGNIYCEVTFSYPHFLTKSEIQFLVSL